MSLPFDKTISLEYLLLPDKFPGIEAIRHGLYHAFSETRIKEIERVDNDLKLQTRNSLFGIAYDVTLTTRHAQKLQIDYTVSYSELLKIIILLLLFIAFFSNFNYTGFLYFSGIFTVLFYAVNVWLINFNIRRTIESLPYIKILQDYETDLPVYEEGRCPACGAILHSGQTVCPDCGLQLRQNRFTKPLDLSKYTDAPIEYHYKPKEKPDEKEQK